MTLVVGGFICETQRAIHHAFNTIHRLSANCSWTVSIFINRRDPVCIISSIFRIMLLRMIVDDVHGIVRVLIRSSTLSRYSRIRHDHRAANTQKIHHVELVEIGLVIRLEVESVTDFIHEVVFSTFARGERNLLYSSLLYLLKLICGWICVNLIVWVIMIDHL